MAERRYNRAPWEGASRRGAALSRVMREMNPPRKNRWITRSIDYSTVIDSLSPEFDDYVNEVVYRWISGYDMDGNRIWNLYPEEELTKYEPNVALLFE